MAEMERDEARTDERMNAAWIALLLVGTAVTLTLVPFWNDVSAPVAPRTRAILHVKQVLLGCTAYAADHGGAYPPSLEVLYPEYVDVEAIFQAIGEDGAILPSRIVYHPGHTDTGEPKAILLEHPVALDGKRIVGYVGGHVVEVPAK